MSLEKKIKSLNVRILLWEGSFSLVIESKTVETPTILQHFGS